MVCWLYDKKEQFVISKSLRKHCVMYAVVYNIMALTNELVIVVKDSYSLKRSIIVYCFKLQSHKTR